jgi:exonuclease III
MRRRLLVPSGYALTRMTETPFALQFVGRKELLSETGFLRSRTMEQQIRVISYNMHGFRQGSCCLAELCAVADIIFVQEHWLGPDDLDKLIVHDDFLCCTSLAMECVLSHSILSGRPFGGVAILIRSSLADCVRIISKTDRCIVLLVGSVILCNLYLPCKSEVLCDVKHADTLAVVAEK